MATMETEASEEEGQHFRQLDESRQSGVEHNITAGGDKVAWLNSDRGRVLGPNASREVRHGETINLSVHGKYENPKKKRRANKASLLTAGARQRILTDIGELSRAGSGNPVTVLQLVDLIAQDLQTKKSPEAYLYYALYDSDSNLYESGKKVLSKKAENKHEELTESIYISKAGYMETLVANETSEDVWFDNFRIEVQTPIVVQETHYDPWGLELTGLGFAYSGLHKNRQLYNGKEYIEENGLNYYDYGAMMYDPTIGRWGVVDPMAAHPLQINKSPYAYAWNNPIFFNDPDGKCPNGCSEKEKTGEGYKEGAQVVNKYGVSEWKGGEWVVISGPGTNSSKGPNNSQNAGIITVTDGSSGPMDVGTTGDIGGMVNTDGIDGLAKSGPSGGIMQKVANILSSLMGILQESSGEPNLNSQDNVSDNSSNHENSGESIKSDSTFVSNSGKLYPDGTVTVNVIIKGDTTNIRTKNSDDSKRLKNDPTVKWTKN